MRSDETMTFLEHLEDFRKTVLRSVLAIFIGMLVCIPFIQIILDFLLKPLRDLGVDTNSFLVILEVMGSFKVAVAVIFWSGLLLASPFIVLFIVQFVFPGLHAHEKRVIKRSAWATIVLFFGGAALGYYGTAHYALQNLLFALPTFMGLGGMEQVLLTNYIMFMLKLVIGFGLAFELPLVLLMVGYADLVDAASLRKYRRHVVVGLLAFAMLLTPPEPVSQIIMGGALYLLYEGCVLLIARHEKRAAIG